MTDPSSDQCGKNIRESLQLLKRGEQDIVRLVQGSIKDILIPDNIQVSLSMDIRDHLVWIDGERIMKVLSSLEANAVEAMPRGGRLTLTIRGNEKQVIITIRDTGTGISRENLDNIFVPFFTTKPAGQGTGLSLPLAYNTIRMHSGRLEIESNADPENGPTGTLVTITLPRSRPG
jgi:signal transduction histidine kinase